MGLFDKLKKQAFSGLVDKIEKATGLDVDGSDSRQNYSQPPKAAPVQQRTSYNQPAEKRSAPYFASIIRECFPQYIVRQRLTAAELGLPAVGNERAYDFVLYSGSRIAGVIMLTPHNRDRCRAFYNAKSAVALNGIPFINFFLHYPNERDYVVARIRSYLN